jgi:hypothetical protein
MILSPPAVDGLTADDVATGYVVAAVDVLLERPVHPAVRASVVETLRNVADELIAPTESVDHAGVVIANHIDLWDLHDTYNAAGIDVSIPVLAANGIFWMTYPYEDGDCMYIGAEAGDPAERCTEGVYERFAADDLVYPLRVLWAPPLSAGDPV